MVSAIRNKLFLLVFWCATFGLQGQNGVWLAGYDEFPGLSGTGVVKLTFVADSVRIDSFSSALPFESTMAVWSDEDNNILFYSNGCKVFNRVHELMDNGDGLNPGDIHDLACENYGYLSPKGMSVIPRPGQPDQFYMIHMAVQNDAAKKIDHGPLYYSLIDLSLNNSLGAVIEKNEVLLSGSLEPFVCVKHGNGRDWWIVAPEFGSDLYHFILIDPNTAASFTSQSIGNAMPFPPCRWERSASISPDGQRYVRFNNYCGAVFLEFDRCEGWFSNPRNSNISNPVFGGGGVAFSSNSQNVFLTHYNMISKVVWDNIPDTLRSSRTLTGAEGTTLHHLELGPDSRIYGSALSSEKYLHVIDSVDLGDDSVRLAARGLSLSVLSARTLPGYPHYGLAEIVDGVCDTIPTAIHNDLPQNNFISVFPNPADYTVNFKFGKSLDSRNVSYLFRIFDLSGGILYQSRGNGSNVFAVDIAAFPPAVYIAQFTNGEDIYSTRFIIE